MKTLPAAVTAALQGQDIWSVTLLSIQIGDTTYYVSDHYAELVIGTDIYLPNGNFLSLANVETTLNTNDNSIDLSLSAIDNTFRQDVLDADSIGGEVSIFRGLLSPSTGELLGTPINVYRGIIYQVAIDEEFDFDNNTQSTASFSVTVEVRSINYLLEQIPGRATENHSNQQVDSTDTSMQYVPALNGLNLRFGGT